VGLGCCWLSSLTRSVLLGTLVLLLGVATLNQGHATPFLRDGEVVDYGGAAVIRSYGPFASSSYTREQDLEELASLRSRVRILESEVRDLRGELSELRARLPARAPTAEPVVACMLATPFHGTFSGRAGTKIEAIAKVLSQCEQRSATGCSETLIKCEGQGL
jgi:hypothetical protein